MTDWWAGIPPAETAVGCGGERHRLRWEAGELRALDHDDAEAERTLAVLGGERCTCVDVLDAWARHADDERVLVLASRGPVDQVTSRSDWRAGPGPGPGPAGYTPGWGGGWTAYAPMPSAYPGPGSPAPEDDLISLLGLGGGLPERLVASVAAAAEAGPRLHAALYGCALAALRSWLGRPDLELELRVVDPDAPPRLTRRDDDALVAELPFSWLGDVSARGLSTVMGRFCLGVTPPPSAGGRWELTTVGADLGTPATIAIIT
jgi:hypothetical protein